MASDTDAAQAATPVHRAGFVALVGRANVGKSTLLNALLGEKVAIVSWRPQTTRRRILGLRTEPGVQAAFLDTPGVHKPATALGKSMLRAAQGALAEADVIVWVVDVSRLPSRDDRTIAGWLADAMAPVILVMNKSDRLPPDHVLDHSQSYLALLPVADWTLTIATTGHNVDAVWQAVCHRLPESPALYPEDQLTDQTDRQTAAELIRESALRLLREEVPHGMDVVITDWILRPTGVTFIEATLIVERAGHKAIVIGKGGEMLRAIGTRGRRAIERTLSAPVYLELHVTVREDWRRREAEIRRLGY